MKIAAVFAVIGLCSIGLLTVDAQAQTPGQVVTIVLPENAFVSDGIRIRDSLQIFAATISVSGVGDIGVSGIPYTVSCCSDLLVIEYRIDKVSEKKEKNIAFTEIEMTNTRQVLKLRLVRPYSDLPGLFSKFGIVARKRSAETEAFLKPYFDAGRKEIFRAPLSVTEPAQLALLKTAMVEFDVKPFRQSFKDSDYFSVKLDLDVVYNDLQLNQAQRIARVANDRVLSLAKDLARAAGAGSGLDGIAVSVKIPHRDFVREDPSSHDIAMFYFSVAKLKEFSESEITSQQLMDASIILANDNRVQVNLGGN